MKSAAPQHYCLVSDLELADRHADEAWHGFVEPVSFGAKQSDLAKFLLSVFPNKISETARKKTLASRSRKNNDAHQRVLEDYRKFIIADCGQMTIEGIGADMDTSQRKFDIERLFVPLNILKTPPDLPLNDPDREEKLLKWQKENSASIAFGTEFAKHKRLALLALPGGGKTLLLKRLAVAYANPKRRDSSPDELPNIDLIPVMIRCREWKEHIRSPIPTMLKNIDAITGQFTLSNLATALAPLFKKGKVLLLIDGLDEIHDDADRAIFTENLEKFLSQNKNTYVVVTSREAGFHLVAPSVARFCERWRIAPLEADAIRLLCSHWHLLMGGDNPESRKEATNITEQILASSSVHRLAENPLLLTMLLVVKHGYGRLPPDRASLYNRAVEVLLDTWNIKGHEPLILREALPQLACVAFELLRRGQQTATERELLTLLEDARARIPKISRYAKDTPDQFLRRVEYRSSLLVKAGHQLEGTTTVPFYQFRHLTFQEFLAAYAVCEGTYLDYNVDDTLLVPLEPYLLSEEWKEVIPMAAVLAGKHAEPIMASLVRKGAMIREELERGKPFDGYDEWLHFPGKLPAPIARLGQCLAEEAEASPETLTSSLELIAFFGRGCRVGDFWGTLVRGPFRDDLIHQAEKLFLGGGGPDSIWVRNTLAVLLAMKSGLEYPDADKSAEVIQGLLREGNPDGVRTALLTIAGKYWSGAMKETPEWPKLSLVEVQKHIFDRTIVTKAAAIWAWALVRQNRREMPPPPHEVLEQLLQFFFEEPDLKLSVAAFALSNLLGLKRGYWQPTLTKSQSAIVKGILQQTKGDTSPSVRTEKLAALVIAFHSRDLIPDEELAQALSAERRGGTGGRIDIMLKALGEVGEKFLSKKIRSKGAELE